VDIDPLVMAQRGVGLFHLIDFILDTAFQGEFALPRRIIDQKPTARFVHRDVRRMADGSISRVEVFELTMDWQGEERLVEVLALEGECLVGTDFFTDCFITIDQHEGGEVQVELPD
jgi:predicted aspartyl protease